MKSANYPKLDEKNQILGISLLLAVIVIPYLYLFYNLPIFQIFGFLIGIILFLYLPGLFILDLLTWKDNPASLSIISILTGMAASPILYYLTNIIGQQWIFIVSIACVSVFVIYNKLHLLKNIKYSLILPQGWWKFIAVFFIVLAVLHFSHFTDLKIIKDGGYQLRTTNYTETIFHLGVINAAEYNIPPNYPYVSGYKLSEYHIDMHILAVIFCKYLSIDPAIMTFYFLPLLLLGLIIAVPAVFFYELHGDINLSLLFGLLMLGADFSFIPAIMSKNIPETYPWTLIFCTTIWSLFTLNGIMAAIPLFFGSALAFQRYFSSLNIKYLLVFSLLTIAEFRVKNFMGLQVIGVSFAALAFIEWKYRLGAWGKALPVLLLTFALIFVDLLIKSYSSGSSLVLKWDLFNGLIQSAGILGMDQWHNAALAPWEHPFILFYALTLYFIGFMGVRVIFLKYCYDVLKTRKPIEPIVPFFLFFIVGGIFLSEIIFLGGKYGTLNLASWFRVQSIIAATYFIAAFIASLKGRNHKIIVTTFVILLSFPTTINFLNLRYDKKYITISKNDLLAVDYIKKSVSGNSVIMEYPNFNFNAPSLSSNFAGRSTILALFRSFPGQKVELQIIKDRINDLKYFFMINNEDTRKIILKKYGAEYLVIPSQLKGIFSNYPWLIMSYSNSDVTIYKINIIQ